MKFNPVSNFFFLRLQAKPVTRECTCDLQSWEVEKWRLSLVSSFACCLHVTSHDIPQLESMFADHNVFFLVTIIIFYSFPCIFFSMGGAIAVHVGVQGLLGPSLSGLAVIDVVEGKKP